SRECGAGRSAKHTGQAVIRSRYAGAAVRSICATHFRRGTAAAYAVCIRCCWRTPGQLRPEQGYRSEPCVTCRWSAILEVAMAGNETQAGEIATAGGWWN